MFSICPSLQPYLEVKWRFHHPDSYSQPGMQSKWSLLLNHQFRGVGTNGPIGPSEFLSSETKGKASVKWFKAPILLYKGDVTFRQRLRTPIDEIAFTAQPKIQSQFQNFRHGRSIFCLPHRPSLIHAFIGCP